MAKQHVIKYYTRLIQKEILTIDDVPDDMKEAVTELLKTLPLRKDMIKNNEE